MLVNETANRVRSELISPTMPENHFLILGLKPLNGQPGQATQ